MNALHVVKTTNIDTNKDIVYIFYYLPDAENKLSEFQQDSGLTGSVLYAGAEIHAAPAKYLHLLYEMEGGSRYTNNLNRISVLDT